MSTPIVENDRRQTSRISSRKAWNFQDPGKRQLRSHFGSSFNDFWSIKAGLQIWGHFSRLVYVHFSNFGPLVFHFCISGNKIGFKWVNYTIFLKISERSVGRADTLRSRSLRGSGPSWAPGRQWCAGQLPTWCNREPSRTEEPSQTLATKKHSKGWHQLGIPLSLSPFLLPWYFHDFHDFHEISMYISIYISISMCISI